MMFFLLFALVIVTMLIWVLALCIMFMGLKQMFVNRDWGAWKGVLICLVVAAIFLFFNRVLFQQLDKYTSVSYTHLTLPTN